MKESNKLKPCQTNSLHFSLPRPHKVGHQADEGLREGDLRPGVVERKGRRQLVAVDQRRPEEVRQLLAADRSAQPRAIVTRLGLVAEGVEVGARLGVVGHLVVGATAVTTSSSHSSIGATISTAPGAVQQAHADGGRHHQRIAEDVHQRVKEADRVEKGPRPVGVLIDQRVEDLLQVVGVEVADQGAQQPIPAAHLHAVALVGGVEEAVRWAGTVSGTLVSSSTERSRRHSRTAAAEEEDEEEEA
ncbi:hypothetical protein TYRP_002920 [Tyrophagus putrescentiae]|nr:hypothetical protein TYRP_002920 [Tyrophagus putrescentiae]